jgi:hypothetical protein
MILTAHAVTPYTDHPPESIAASSLDMYYTPSEEAYLGTLLIAAKYELLGDNQVLA